ncbi:hypothetical protein BD560DRAFT_446620 [Blakeslea trispora]|nr:hypothetical protein BD560DRAFT_446620 [Blakeslea trispora]
MSLKINTSKREVLQVILDQPRIYLEESLGSVMIRGEVIVCFSRDTSIQGPIDLVFEGIQRFLPWKEIMKGSSVGPAIETKLQVIELSLVPPNTKGIMPSGVQRFPFEFPIPTSLPASIEIPGRLKIFYQISATLQRSFSNQDDSRHKSMHSNTWVDWALSTCLKKKYLACSPIRIVRAMESVLSDSSFANHTNTNQGLIENRSESQMQSPEQSDSTDQLLLPWNRRHLDAYSGSFDQQHDQLAFSFAGRASTNFHRPLSDLSEVQGIRYKIGVDRTAIAIGTSIGIELMIEPTMVDALVKSVLVKIAESRKYSMKVPTGHTPKAVLPETKTYSENLKMVLKWAYGHPMNEEGMAYESKLSSSTKKSERYVYKRTENSKSLFYFDPPQPGSSKSFLKRVYSTDKKSKKISEDPLDECAFSSTDTFSKSNMINLKELNQPVKLKEYFGGRFVLPVPDCSDMLNPSMNHESIKISHWMQMCVTLVCNGKEFNLDLEAPVQLLDCRLVATDDEGQTVLPPPPSYVPGSSRSYHENNWSVSTFWEQREPITALSEWGSCRPCPCEYRRDRKLTSQRGHDSVEVTSSNREVRDNSDTSSSRTSNSYPPSLLPEWGPPPCYSEN